MFYEREVDMTDTDVPILRGLIGSHVMDYRTLMGVIDNSLIKLELDLSFRTLVLQLLASLNDDTIGDPIDGLYNLMAMNTWGIDSDGAIEYDDPSMRIMDINMKLEPLYEGYGTVFPFYWESEDLEIFPVEVYELWRSVLGSRGAIEEEDKPLLFAVIEDVVFSVIELLLNRYRGSGFTRRIYFNMVLVKDHSIIFDVVELDDGW